MKRFGDFVLRGRWQACAMALLFAALPLLGWFSLAIVALVTLRKGAQEGIWVLICALIPAVAFALLGHTALPLINGVLGAILVWILAIVLRDKASWSYVFVVAGCFGVLGVLAIHGYSNDINQWWQQKMLAYMQTFGSEIKLDVTQQKQIIGSLAQIATGAQAALLLLLNLGWLVLARNWQAALFNPGQLKPELHAIRLPKWLAIAAIILMALALVTRWPVCIDLLPVVLLPFVLAGLSVVHFIVATRKLSWMWLVLLYALMVLFLPYWAAALMVLALLDSVWNIRQRVSILSK